MQVLILDSTTKSIEAKLTGAATTTNPAFTASWADNTGTTFTEGSTDGILNGTSAVTVVAAPASSTRRIVKSLTIQNQDTAAVTVILQYNNNGTTRQIAKFTLSVNDTMTLQGVYDNGGNIKTTFSSPNYVPNSLYSANSVLYATTASTPIALTVGTQTVVGRAGSDITALAIDSDLTSTSSADDTVPSAKATKTYADLKLALTGGTMSGAVTLAENASVVLPTTLSADGKYGGIVVSGTAGEALSFGQVCYLKSTDTKWYKALGSGTSTSIGQLGCCVQDSSGTTTILLYGNVRADAIYGTTLTVGQQQYISGVTAGSITPTLSGTTDYVIRVVGFATGTTSILFNPSPDYITHI